LQVFLSNFSKLLHIAQKNRGVIVFYDVFIHLCVEKGVKPSRVTMDLELSKATATKWKNGSVPTGETLQKLAEYFDVSVDYLLGNEKKSPETNPGDLIIADEDIIRIQRARSKMNDAEKAHMMETLKVIYKNYFTDDFEDTDTEE